MKIIIKYYYYKHAHVRRNVCDVVEETVAAVFFFLILQFKYWSL